MVDPLSEPVPCPEPDVCGPDSRNRYHTQKDTIRKPMPNSRPASADTAVAPAEGLKRAIGRWDLTALAINGIIGAGIFGLPSRAYALTGAWSLVAFAACAALAMLIALCFAEVGSRYQQTGGPYLYAREALGAPAGFTVGWLWWLSRVAAYAANLNLLVSYAAFLLPSLAEPATHAAVLITITSLLLILNIAGVQDSTLASNIFTAGKLAALLFFVVIGFTHLDTSRLQLQTMPSVNDLSTAVLLLVYAFTGFEMVAVPAGEVRDPQRELPRALITAIAVVAVLYMGIQVVCIGTLPGLAQSTRPLADAAQQFAGDWGGKFIVIGAGVSILGNLNLLLLASSRIPFAMAHRGELPGFLAWTHPRTSTPVWALIVTAAITLTLALSKSFLAAITISSASRLLAYGATALSLWILRRRPGTPPAQFHLPAAGLVALLTLALTLWLLIHTSPSEAVQAAVLTVAGLLLFGATRLARQYR